ATVWDPGAVIGSEVDLVAVSGSTVYVGGYFGYIGGQPRSALAALDATTGAVTTWDPHPDYTVRDLVVSGSTVYIAGGFSAVGGEERNSIAAVDAASGAVTAWNPN